LDIGGGITGILVGGLCINYMDLVSYRDELAVKTGELLPIPPNIIEKLNEYKKLNSPAIQE